MNSSLSNNAEVMYPNGWKLQRLNVVASLYGRIGWQGLTTDEYLDEGPWLVTGTDFVDGGINWDACVRISDRRWREARQIQLQPGDLLITKDGTVGKLAIVSNQPGKASLNSGLMRIVPRREDEYTNKYLYYVLNTDVFTEWFKSINAGVSTIQHLFQKDFNHFIFPLPPLSEQKSIVSYLDRICGQSNRLLDCINRQIGLLESYRSSIIHEAVTKGLNSNVPMKSIGASWIRELPITWEYKPFKLVAHVASNLVEPSLYSDMIEIDPDNIESGSGKLVRVKTVGEVGAISAKQLFFEGQILYSKIRPALNKVTIAPDDGLCSADMYPISTDQCVRWLSYVMRSDLFVQQTSLISDRVAMPKVNADQLAAIKIPVPPIKEQERIASYLDRSTEAIDAVIDTKRKQLELLKKRRQSLIYEYVTGKRRVGTKG